MIQVLLVVQDQDSHDLIKAVCCYKGCRVLVADNSYNLLLFLQKEKIDIVFFDLSHLNSLALDMIFAIDDLDHERPAILISEKISLAEEIELQKRNIFYRAVKPVNSDEIEQVIEAAINAVSTKTSELERYTEETIVTENSIIEERIDKRQQKTSEKVSRDVFGIFPTADRRIISFIQDIDFKYLENALSFVVTPVKSFDTFLMNLTNRIL